VNAMEHDVTLTTDETVIAVFDESCGSLVAMKAPDWIMRLRSAAAAGECLMWSPLLDGTFRIQVVVESTPRPTVSDELTSRFDGGSAVSCPSGRLVVCGTRDRLHRIDVPVGDYDCTLVWSHEEEARHWDVSSVENYPSAEGPDGVLRMYRRPT
jgi:hypothetical protein